MGIWMPIWMWIVGGIVVLIALAIGSAMRREAGFKAGERWGRSEPERKRQDQEWREQEEGIRRGQERLRLLLGPSAEPSAERPLPPPPTTGPVPPPRPRTSSSYVPPSYDYSDFADYGEDMPAHRTYTTSEREDRRYLPPGGMR
jgi:hypothetical protein